MSTGDHENGRNPSQGLRPKGRLGDTARLLPCAIGRLMQKLGRGYVGQFNARQRRTGTLWEGRYKASLVDSEGYVLHCQRYIDLNPVCARMTDDPAEYPWSSCPAHCGRRSDAMLTPHPAYTALASGPEARSEVYRLLLREALRPVFWQDEA